MNVAATFRAMPTLFRVSFAEAVAYRAEMFVWVFSTTMPLIMLMLWTTVTTVSPVTGQGGQTWSAGDFTAYFLAVFIIRQLISAWASWEINFEVRRGNLAMRLLRPMHPVLGYAVSNLAYLPLRALVTLPVVALLIATQGQKLPTDWTIWALWCLAMLGSWVINFFVNVAVGALAFYLESSLKLMEVWLALFFVSAGYLFPLDVVKVGWVRTVIDVLPFRYIIALPAELMTGRLSVDQAWRAIGMQWAWAAGAFLLSLFLWRRGVKRFQSFGG